MQYTMADLYDWWFDVKIGKVHKESPMSERKLRAGYVQGKILMAIHESPGNGHLCSAVFCAADGRWWPWNLAPAECFEDVPGEMFGVKQGVFPGGNPPGEAKCPEPKFEVGQWLYDRVLGDEVIVVARTWNGVWNYTLSNGRNLPEGLLRPCAPVCTAAQLAIRVGDEVRVTHDWSPQGMPAGEDEAEPGPNVYRVTSLTASEVVPGAIVVGFSDTDGIWLWNLDPVKPRA